ncbi:Rgg family transcriptional regulator, partial [Enterococcus faecalis]
KQDIPKLHRLKKSVDHNQVMSKKQKALLLALLDLSIAGLSDSLISMSPDTKQLLQNYLFTLPTWNKLKLSVYGNALRVYTIEINQLFINSI